MPDKKLEELQFKLQQKVELGLIRKDDVYIIEDEEGFFCTCCFDYSDKLVHLHHFIDKNGEIDNRFLHCTKCKTKILNPDFN